MFLFNNCKFVKPVWKNTSPLVHNYATLKQYPLFRELLLGIHALLRGVRFGFVASRIKC